MATSVYNDLSAMASFTQRRHFVNKFVFKRMSDHYILYMNFNSQQKKKSLC